MCDGTNIVLFIGFLWWVPYKRFVLCISNPPVIPNWAPWINWCSVIISLSRFPLIIVCKVNFVGQIPCRNRPYYINVCCAASSVNRVEFSSRSVQGDTADPGPGLGLLYFGCSTRLAQLLCPFCLSPISPSRIRQTVALRWAIWRLYRTIS